MLHSGRKCDITEYQYLTEKGGKQVYAMESRVTPQPIEACSIKSLCDAYSAELSCLEGVYIIESEMYPALLKRARKDGDRP